MKKGISLLLCLCMLLTMSIGAIADAAAGTYSATAQGRNGDLTVEVVVDAQGRIESVAVTTRPRISKHFSFVEIDFLNCNSIFAVTAAVCSLRDTTHPLVSSSNKA